jgi:hypothetical protein
MIAAAEGEHPASKQVSLMGENLYFATVAFWILTFQSRATLPERICRLAGLRGKMFEPAGEFFSEPHGGMEWREPLIASASSGKKFGCVSLVTLLLHYNKVTRRAGP